jgi:hypothetical protein
MQDEQLFGIMGTANHDDPKGILRNAGMAGSSMMKNII